MSVARIAGRYAKSLMDMAIENNKLENIKSDIDLFNDAVGNRELELLLKSPIVNADKKKTILEAIFGGKVEKLTLEFFKIVVSKGRENLLPEIGQAFVGQYNEHLGITRASLTTAGAVSEDMQKKIVSSIKSFGVEIDKVNIDHKVDPDLIGGYILQIGDRMINASVQNKLTEIRKSFVQ